MTIACLFYFVLELLEVREHFALLTHGIKLDVPGEVLDEHYIVTTTTECCRLGSSPYLLIYYIKDPFAHVPLLWEQLSVLFAELIGFRHTCNLLLRKGRESNDDSFRQHSFEILEIDVAYPLMPQLYVGVDCL